MGNSCGLLTNYLDCTKSDLKYSQYQEDSRYRPPVTSHRVVIFSRTTSPVELNVLPPRDSGDFPRPIEFPPNYEHYKANGIIKVSNSYPTNSALIVPLIDPVACQRCSDKGEYNSGDVIYYSCCEDSKCKKCYGAGGFYDRRQIPCFAECRERSHNAK